MQPSMQFTFSAARAHSHSWFIFKFLSISTPLLLLQNYFLAIQTPVYTIVQGYSIQGTGFCVFLVLNFMRFLSAHSSVLLRSLWIAALLPRIPITSHNLVSPAPLLKEHSTSSPRTLRKTFTWYWSQYKSL